MTPRLRGERLTEAHEPFVAALQRDNDYMRYMGGPRDDQAIAELMERNLAHWDQHGFGMWVLHDMDANPAGMAGMRHVDEDSTSDVAIGYGLIRDLWGRGLATEAAKACVDRARDTLHLDSIIARAHAENAASIGVMKKLGFVLARDFEEGGERGVEYRLRLSG